MQPLRRWIIWCVMAVMLVSGYPATADSTPWKCQTLSAHLVGVDTLHYSVDGKFLAATGGTEIQRFGGIPHQVRLWRIQTRQFIGALSDRENTYEGAFSPDHKLLATVTYDKIKLWEVQTQQMIRTLPIPAPMEIAFSPQGDKLLAVTSRYLATRSGWMQKNRLRVWDVPNGFQEVSMSHGILLKLWCLSLALMLALIMGVELSNSWAKHSSVLPQQKTARVSHGARKLMVAKIIATLQACPDWTAIPESTDLPDSPVRKKIMLCMAELSHYKLDVLREAIQKLLKLHRNGSTWGRLYILNRYLFAVPPRGPHGEAYSAGFFRPQGAKDAIALWPLSMTAHGDLALTGSYGGYSGPGYEALRQFDDFKAHFGPRITSAHRSMSAHAKAH